MRAMRDSPLSQQMAAYQDVSKGKKACRATTTSAGSLKKTKVCHLRPHPYHRWMLTRHCRHRQMVKEMTAISAASTANPTHHTAPRGGSLAIQTMLNSKCSRSWREMQASCHMTGHPIQRSLQMTIQGKQSIQLQGHCSQHKVQHSTLSRQDLRRHTFWATFISKEKEEPVNSPSQAAICSTRMARPAIPISSMSSQSIRCSLLLQRIGPTHRKRGKVGFITAFLAAGISSLTGV